MALEMRVAGGKGEEYIANTSIVVVVRVRQGSRGQGLQRCEEAWHVRSRCTSPKPRLHTLPHHANRTCTFRACYDQDGNKPVSNTDNTQGKAKYNKWKEVVDAGTTKKQAEDKYVELGEQLVAKHDK
jgi:hypothetical protein